MLRISTGAGRKVEEARAEQCLERVSFLTKGRAANADESPGQENKPQE
jgi:hypothetical protein